jgi:hypothetical protein
MARTIKLESKKKKRNWKEPKDYEFANTLNSKKWAWEFLRRNPDYIQEWEKELPLEFERIKKLLSDPETKDAPHLEGYRTNTPESIHFIIPGHSLNKYFKKWGILNLVNPEQDNPFPNPFNQFPSFKYGNVRGGNIGYSRHLDDSFPDGPYISIVYDISRPLKAQFTNAQKVLLEWQNEQVKEGKIHINTVKKHKDNWIEYLRILDAKAEKISNEEIALVMFPNLKNEYPGYAGNEKVRKSLKRAEYLIKKGYREIAMTF